MLYLFHGTDSIKTRDKASKLVAGLLKRKPNASHFRLDSESFTQDSLAEYIKSQGLFSERYIVVLDHTFENEEAKDNVMQNIRAISDSSNIFVILEGKLDKKTLARLEKSSEKSNFSNLASEPGYKVAKFNIFSLTESLGKRNSRALWTLYQKAIRAGVQPEEIHGILFWQIKIVSLVSKNDTSGIKPFVVSKARGFLKNYSEPELSQLSSQLVAMYHEARRGVVELPVALERFILSV